MVQTKRIEELVPLYYVPATESFHVNNAKGLCILRDICNNENDVRVAGYELGIPNMKRPVYILVEIENDIDMSSVVNWRAFSFVGSFNGNGHTISNLRAVQASRVETDPLDCHAALFFCFGMQGAEKSLLTGVTLKNCMMCGSRQAAGFAISICNTDIQDCDFIDDNFHDGGFAIMSSGFMLPAAGIACNLENVLAIHCGVQCNVYAKKFLATGFAYYTQGECSFIGCYAKSRVLASKSAAPFIGNFSFNSQRLFFIGCGVVYDIKKSPTLITKNLKVWDDGRQPINNSIRSCYSAKYDCVKLNHSQVERMNSACQKWFDQHSGYRQSRAFSASEKTFVFQST